LEACEVGEVDVAVLVEVRQRGDLETSTVSSASSIVNAKCARSNPA